MFAVDAGEEVVVGLPAAAVQSAHAKVIELSGALALRHRTGTSKLLQAETSGWVYCGLVNDSRDFIDLLSHVRAVGVLLAVRFARQSR